VHPGRDFSSHKEHSGAALDSAIFPSLALAGWGLTTAIDANNDESYVYLTSIKAQNQMVALFFVSKLDKNPHRGMERCPKSKIRATLLD
jgi:hypothetical protein